MNDLISRQDAIEAVATVTMSIHLSNVLCDKLLALPSAEPKTVYCKDCKYWYEWENGCGSCHRSENGHNWFGVDATDYCSFGKRKEQNHECK